MLAATAVIHGQMTLGMMLAVQYIIGQLNAPVEQLMNFLYSLQDVKISLEHINEIHEMENEENNKDALSAFPTGTKSLSFKNADFKYDPHNPNKTLDGISITIPEGKVTAIVGTSGKRKDNDDKTSSRLLSPVGRRNNHPAAQTCRNIT